MRRGLQVESTVALDAGRGVDIPPLMGHAATTPVVGSRGFVPEKPNPAARPPVQRRKRRVTGLGAERRNRSLRGRARATQTEHRGARGRAYLLDEVTP